MTVRAASLNSPVWVVIYNLRMIFKFRSPAARICGRRHDLPEARAEGAGAPFAASSWRILLIFFTVALCLSGCSRQTVPPAIIGTWLVNMPAAPYPYHLFVFHADGTVIQSNPDSGDPRHSDSNLMGAWISAGGHVTAKLVETSADRTTHKFVSRTEIAMSLQVQVNTLHGTGTASVFDAKGKPDGTPHPFTFDGDRILP